MPELSQPGLSGRALSPDSGLHAIRARGPHHGWARLRRCAELDYGAMLPQHFKRPGRGKPKAAPSSVFGRPKVRLSDFKLSTITLKPFRKDVPDGCDIRLHRACRTIRRSAAPPPRHHRWDPVRSDAAGGRRDHFGVRPNPHGRRDHRQHTASAQRHLGTSPPGSPPHGSRLLRLLRWPHGRCRPRLPRLLRRP